MVIKLKYWTKLVKITKQVTPEKIDNTEKTKFSNATKNLDKLTKVMKLTGLVQLPKLRNLSNSDKTVTKIHIELIG